MSVFFISEENRKLHEEHIRKERLRLSVFEKSYMEIVGLDARGILRSGLKRREREEAWSIKTDIIAHEIYFSSFGDGGGVCREVKRQYGSEAAFLYALHEASIDKSGFLLVFSRDGKIDYYAGEDYRRVITEREACLAVDLCEHAYFLDWGFDKAGYLRGALSNLNLSKLSNVNKGD